MKNSRTRNETGYRNVTSRSGQFSPHINEHTSSRLSRYCKKMNINKTKFVEQCINEKLDVLEREMLEDLNKEELIELCMKEWGR